MMFGDFQYMCTNLPSYPWCNLFYRQAVQNGLTDFFTGASADPESAPVGINPNCGIPRLSHSYPDGGSSLMNIANVIAAGLSFFVALFLAWRVGVRSAAVGRSELRLFLLLYALVSGLQLVDTGAFLTQGGLPITIITAIHAGVTATLFWGLLSNAIVTTQIVEDGTIASLGIFTVVGILFFVATTFTSLDVALTFTPRFGPSDPFLSLNSIPLFVLVIIWPLVAALISFIIYAYTTLAKLREPRPFALFLLAAVCFVLAELDGYLLNKVICSNTGSKIDGSFVATILYTFAVMAIVAAWRLITEEAWDEDEEQQYY